MFKLDFNGKKTKTQPIGKPRKSVKQTPPKKK